MAAYLASHEPELPTRPGVLVLHEIFGLTDDIRRITRRFAAAGYIALAPDLYSAGTKALCVVRAVRAMRSGRGAPLVQLDRAVAFLRNLSGVDEARIGVAGFCMGGGFALWTALRSPMKVAAPYYGDVPSEDELRGICPVVAGYGARDAIFAPKGRALKRRLDRVGVPNDVRIYENAGHSYMSRHEPGLVRSIGAKGPMKASYEHAAAEDSWQRMLAFFEAHL